MITNAQIKMVRSLREKKYRDELGLFVVEGEKMVAEAIQSGFKVVNQWTREEIGAEAMSRISSLSSPSPVLAVVAVPDSARKGVKDADALVAEAPGLCLALDGVRDPGNLGTIIRIADWFGIDTVFASEDTVELFNPKVVQATMGAIFRKKFVYCNIPEVCSSFKASGRRVYGTFMEGTDIYSTDLSADGLIVMGNESEGVSAATSECVTDRIHIPSFAKGPTAESLNVAVATAITVSEFRRR